MTQTTIARLKTEAINSMTGTTTIALHEILEMQEYLEGYETLVADLQKANSDLGVAAHRNAALLAYIDEMEAQRQREQELDYGGAG